MTEHISKDRVGRRGVEAIFTARPPNRSWRFTIGLLGIVTGILLWIGVALISQFPGIFQTPEIGFYLTTSFDSLGIILVIVGAGVSLSFSGPNSRDLHRPEEVMDLPQSQETRLDRNTPFQELKLSDTPHVTILTRSTRFGLIGFLLSCVIIALYSGLAEEYQSNPSMRLWIQGVLPLGQYFLNTWVALAIAGLLGFLLVQFLPGRRFAG